jgi:hypothetical protein
MRHRRKGSKTMNLSEAQTLSFEPADADDGRARGKSTCFVFRLRLHVCNVREWSNVEIFFFDRVAE